MFAPSLYPVGSQDWPGDFATQAERDYLFDVRRVDTDISHLLFEAHAAGSTFKLPAGRVKSGWGHRVAPKRDRLHTQQRRRARIAVQLLLR